MRIYNQNIWGNFSAEDHCIANRNLLIKEMIEECSPDVCCFQECNPMTSRSGDTPIQEILKPDYVEIMPETVDKNFTPVFYNKSKFELIECGFMPFEGFNDHGSKSINWGVFKEKKTGILFAVASVHFWWMSRGEIDENQRRENAKASVKIARNIYEKYNIPVFVTGDLNSGEKNNQGIGGYNEMIKLGMKDVRDIAKETDFSDTCGDYPIMENGVFVKGGELTCTIDYMFVLGEELIQAEKFKVNNSKKARVSSDHSPLVFDFKMK